MAPSDKLQLSAKRLSQIADELGRLKAKIAPLTNREIALKKILLDAGVPYVDGEAYRAAIVRYTRESLDMEAVKKKLSKQFLRSHTREIEAKRVDVHALIRDSTKKAAVS